MMNLPVLPNNLPGLTEREAITDAIYRAIICFDVNDENIFDSAYYGSDAEFILNGQSTKGTETIKNRFMNVVGPMDSQHFVTNIRIQHVKGENKAIATAYAMNQHCPPSKGHELNGPKYLVGATYYGNLIKDEKDNDLWKCEKFEMQTIWAQGDSKVMTGEA